jgi:hypothetical protein
MSGNPFAKSVCRLPGRALDVTTAASRLLRFWFEPSSAVDLAVCRVVFYTGLFLAYWPVDFSLWGDVSSAFWMPLPAFSSLHLAPLSPPRLDAVQTIWRVALLTSALGWCSTLSMATAAALGFYLLGLPHNFGHVFHFDALLVITLAVMACSRAGDALSLDSRTRLLTPPAPSGEYTWPIRLIWTATALVFFAAGLSKLRHGGIEWVTSSNMSIVLTTASYHVSDADPVSMLNLWIARHQSLSELLAFASLTIELTFIAALFSRRARMVLVPAAAAMLVGIRLLMGPTFGGFLLVNVFWIPWAAIAHRAMSGVKSSTPAPVSDTAFIAAARENATLQKR